MAGVDLPFACTCNTLRGRLIGVSRSNGTRIECFCTDCRAAEVYAGQPDPAPGAVQLYQTTPDKVRIDAGEDQLAVFSFSPKGLLRWQAKCCGAVLFNTVRTAKVPFASLRTDHLEDDSALGPVVAQAFVQKSDGKQGHKGGSKLLMTMVTRVLPCLISGRWKQTPFFDVETGKPSRDVRLISREERAALPLP